MHISSQFSRRIVRIGIPGLLLLVLLTACGTGGSTNPTSTSNTTPTQGGTKSTSTSPAGQVTEFPVTAHSDPEGITTGPDGNLWFTDGQGDKIGRITPRGTISEFPLVTPNSTPSMITTGPDGNLWFTEPGANKIGRIAPGK